MQTALSIAQIVVAVLMIGAILLQNRGAGLGVAFGGESNVFSAKRGPERVLFNATVVLAVLFAGLAATNALFF